MVYQGEQFAPSSSFENLNSLAEGDVGPVYSEGMYQCPYSPNVTPDYDRYLDGSGHYNVCYHRDSREKILVHGRTRESDTICIYPVEIVDEQHVYVKPDAQGLPWNTCVQVADTGVHAEFAGASFNAVIVVERHLNQQMRECLIGVGSCPDYSFGRFR